MTKYLDKFFGIVAPQTGAAALAVMYSIVGLVFAILSFGRCTGLYGYWGVTRGSTWHKRQFVSCSWGFLLMFLCWGIVYIAVEDNHVEKVNTGCMEINPGWTREMCDKSRKRAATVATVLVTVGMIFGIYFTLVVSRWVSGIEWAEHLEAEKLLEDWRNGHGEQPHIKDPFAIQIEGEHKA
ncbi:hypothetical protein BGZ73_003067 [Actinomortierella ambigua]|nr:hypothetical protein BGZ73_003067 [Actinomortierella ambigua]